MTHYESIPVRILANALLPVLCLVIGIAAPPSASAASSTYAITQPGDFGTLNLSTGAFTKLGNAGITPTGMGEVGSNLYIAGQGSSSLYNVNLSNGSLTLVGNGSIPYAVFGATTSSLYGIGTDNKLYSISAATGSSTLIGPTGLSIGSNTVAMSANASGLYVTLDTGSGSALYSVSTSTGLATTIGNTALPIHAMVYRNGLLYAAVDGGALFTLDPATGEATFVTNTRTGIRGMAEPASTFTVLHNFSGGQDGATPYTGLTMDKAGNFYGTTYAGGASKLGTVYRLKRSGSSWVADGLYSFRGGASDGAQPLGRVSLAPDGSLYGTMSVGGPGQFCGVGCGGIFQLRPPATFCRSVSCPWIESVLYQFAGIPDGGFPSGELVFDEGGNIYGTTVLGGRGAGTLYELTPSADSWTESTIYDFNGAAGFEPYGGIISDSAGNLYGTNQEGGAYNAGNVFQFKLSGSGWTGSFLYNFQGGSDGRDPSAGLIFDQLGNVYGASTDGGTGGGGTVFELSPSGGGWTYTVLYSFAGSRDYRCPNPNNQYAGSGPWASLAMDGAGILYGTTLCDGSNKLGNVFKLTPSGGGWTYTSLHDFTGADDGAYPISNVTVDANGNLYGTASGGGSQGHGVVWEITP